MNKNKYRGLTFKGKEVKGHYCQIEGQHFIIHEDAKHTWRGGACCVMGVHEVDPETVGQFVCLLDKNGKEEVYANDIVSGNIRNDSGLFRGVVVWSDSLFCWTVRAANGHEIDLCGLHHIEKIGNVCGLNYYGIVESEVNDEA